MSHGTEGSVRPDNVSVDRKISFEVKNYNLSTPAGERSLVNNIVKQAEQRVVHLPPEMKFNQKINIDLAGQNLSEARQRSIKQQIVEKSGGVIKFGDIRFRD